MDNKEVQFHDNEIEAHHGGDYLVEKFLKQLEEKDVEDDKRKLETMLTKDLEKESKRKNSRTAYLREYTYDSKTNKLHQVIKVDASFNTKDQQENGNLQNKNTSNKSRDERTTNADKKHNDTSNTIKNNKKVHFDEDVIEDHHGGDYLVQQFLKDLKEQEQQEDNENNVVQTNNIHKVNDGDYADEEKVVYFEEHEIESHHGGDYLVQLFLDNLSEDPNIDNKAINANEKKKEGAPTNPTKKKLVTDKYLNHVQSKYKNNTIVNAHDTKSKRDKMQKNIFLIEDIEDEYGDSGIYSSPALEHRLHESISPPVSEDGIVLDQLPTIPELRTTEEETETENDEDKDDRQVAAAAALPNSMQETVNDTEILRYEAKDDMGSLPLVKKDRTPSAPSQITNSNTTTNYGFDDNHAILPVKKVEYKVKTSKQIVAELMRDIEEQKVKKNNTRKLTSQKQKQTKSIIRGETNRIQKRTRNDTRAAHSNNTSISAKWNWASPDKIAISPPPQPSHSDNDNINSSKSRSNNHSHINATAKVSQIDVSSPQVSLIPITMKQQQERHGIDTIKPVTIPSWPAHPMEEGLTASIKNIEPNHHEMVNLMPSTTTGSNTHSNESGPTFLRKIDHYKLLEQENDIADFLNNTLERINNTCNDGVKIVENDNISSSEPTRDDSMVGNKGNATDTNYDDSMLNNINETADSTTLEATSGESGTTKNSNSQNESLIADLLSTNKTLENKVAYQNRIIDTLNAGMVAQEFELRYTNRKNNETTKANEDLRFMMNDLEDTLKSVVDTNETSDRARKIINDFMEINNELNSSTVEINERRPTSILLSPRSSNSNESYSSNNESYSSSTSASSSNYNTYPNGDPNGESRKFNNETITSVVLPATLIDENDIVDHLLYPSPEKIISNTDGNYNRNRVVDVNTLFVENTLSKKSVVHNEQQMEKQEDTDEIWV